MNVSKKPMSTRHEYDLNDEDYDTNYERNTSTGCSESITRFSDGSSRRNGGGPAGPMNYDKYGEEC